MNPDGTCPSCGRALADPVDQSTPWHFKLLVVSGGVYLGWRAVQGVSWLVHRL